MMPSLEREYRTMPVMTPLERRDEDTEPKYRVEGYASTFEPYTLYTDPDSGAEYKEQIDPKAFDGTDMSDVVFLYNHEGQVMARNRNGSLQLSVDDHGLHVVADLGGSARGREMYEEIRSGLVDQMSFAFTVAEDEYDKKSRTRMIRRFRKLYDVSGVSVPANPGTAINARSATWVDGAIEQERAEQAERLAVEKMAERRQAALARLKGGKINA